MVTHNPDLTAYASRIVYMRDGAVVEDKPLKKNEIVDLDRLTKEDQAVAQEETVSQADSQATKKSSKTKRKSTKKGKKK
jgi:ABC-type glutathione transport system ATPase component